MAKEEKPIQYEARVMDTKGVAQRLDLQYLSKPNRFRDLRRKLTWIAPLVALFVECYYLGFSMLDYSSERNKMSAQQSIIFISRHKGLAIGNGMVFYMMHLVPLIGWLFAPSYAVIAATLSLFNAKKSHVII